LVNEALIIVTGLLRMLLSRNISLPRRSRTDRHEKKKPRGQRGFQAMRFKECAGRAGREH